MASKEEPEGGENAEGEKSTGEVRWGEAIRPERAQVLEARLAQWQQESDGRHGTRRGPFDMEGEDGWTERLTGADAFFLATCALAGPGGDVAAAEAILRDEGQRIFLNLSALHLEGAFLSLAHLEGAVLRKAHLEGAFLGKAHLEGAFLYDAHLEGAFLGEAHLDRAHLEDAVLREAHLEGAYLVGASFDKTSHLNDAVLTGAAFDQVTFDNTNLTVVDWSRVGLLGDELRARKASDEEGKRKNRSTHLTEYRAAVRANRRLAVFLQANGLSEDASRYNYRAQLLQRTSLLYEGHIPKWLGSWFLAALAGYGYRPGRTILWYLAVVSGFALAFFAFSPGSATHLTWNEALVVSLTAFHGRGFFSTTFQPGDPLAALAAIEAVIGLLIEISFIATFTQRFFGAK